MTSSARPPVIVRKLVVIFDICSSTALLEDLIRTENQERWAALLGHLKRYLWLQGHKAKMYKFQGDGWILLFDDGEVKGRQLLALLRGLSTEYQRLFTLLIEPVLSGVPRINGLTFGVDEGSLMRFQMNKQMEFIGRALNVASRLQSAVKTLDEQPAGTLLISANAFARLALKVSSDPIQCALANVTGGAEYRVHKIVLSSDAA